MSKVSIITPLRDASYLLDDFMRRYREFWRSGLELDLVFVEGDSQDDTWAKVGEIVLQHRTVRAVKCDTGQPRYGSVVDANRFKVLATVFNRGIEAVDLARADYVLMLPVDIITQPDLIVRLAQHNLPLVSPLVFHVSDGNFYDTWAFRDRLGHGLGPFHITDTWRIFPNGPTQMNTIGGVMLMKAEVLRAGARYTEAEVDRGLCQRAAELGFSCWADPTTKVYHP